MVNHPNRSKAPKTDATPPLSDRLAALTKPDRETDARVWKLLRPDMVELEGRLTMRHAPRWTSDINLIVAEIERRGWMWFLGHLDPSDARYAGTVSERGHLGVPTWRAIAPTPCLALLLALVAAVESP